MRVPVIELRLRKLPYIKQFVDDVSSSILTAQLITMPIQTFKERAHRRIWNGVDCLFQNCCRETVLKEVVFSQLKQLLY